MWANLLQEEISGSVIIIMIMLLHHFVVYSLCTGVYPGHHSHRHLYISPGGTWNRNGCINWMNVELVVDS